MPAIQIEHLWKTFKRGKTRLGTLRNSASYLWSKLERKEEAFHALEDINLEIQHGEVLGIVGHNGAGKSTLLKLLSRITAPTRGRIVIHGKLSSLLEAGVGFHPELTGRDNIYLSGTLNGLKQKEIDARFEEIVEFSGQSLYLDTPVKHYSSGMAMRLGFAISAYLDPEIFIMDEMLVTADQEFRQKSTTRIRELFNQGKTIILVSHQLDYLRELCTRAIRLDHGRIVDEGPVNDVLSNYLIASSSNGKEPVKLRKDRKGSGKIFLADIQLQNAEGEKILQGQSGEELNILVEIACQSQQLDHVSIRMVCHDIMGRQWFVINSKVSTGFFTLNQSHTFLTCRIPKLPLSPGNYTFDVMLKVENEISDAMQNAFELTVLPGPFYKTGLLPMDTNGMLVEYDWDIRSNKP